MVIFSVLRQYRLRAIVVNKREWGLPKLTRDDEQTNEGEVACAGAPL
jgi:hypothetical protein